MRSSKSWIKKKDLEKISLAANDSQLRKKPVVDPPFIFKIILMVKYDDFDGEDDAGVMK